MTEQTAKQARRTIVSSAPKAELQCLLARNFELFEHQEQAQAARNNFAELYDNASEALISLGSAGLIRTANLAAAELLGRERSRLVGHPLRLFVDQEDRAQLAHFLSQAAGEAASKIDVRLLTRDATVTCRLRARRSSPRPEVTYLMLTPEHAGDGRR